MELAKAEKSLRTAQLCYAQGLYNSSASRACDTMFQAAQAALEAAGFARLEWSHVGLHATFVNELTRRRKLYPSRLVSDPAIVMDLRHTADYREHDLGKRQAMRALNKARGFVDAVKETIFLG